MDILVGVILVICVFFGTLIAFCDDINLPERAVGTGIFYTIASIMIGVLILFSYVLDSTYTVIKHESYAVTSVTTDNDTGAKTTQESPVCEVTIKQHYPLMIFLGISTSTTYNIACSNLHNHPTAMQDIKSTIKRFNTQKQ